MPLEVLVTEWRVHVEEQVRAPAQVIREPVLRDLHRFGGGPVDHYQHLVPELGKLRFVLAVHPAPGQLFGEHAAGVAVQSEVTDRVPTERHGAGQDR
ncbi:MAG: hypothetical protein P8125_07975, partial [Gemmatimonadota bacterium]